MAAMIARVDSSWLHQLKLRYEDEETESITKKYDDGGNEEERLIPPEHVIVGFYGTICKHYRITSLGFVLMDTSYIDE